MFKDYICLIICFQTSRTQINKTPHENKRTQTLANKQVFSLMHIMFCGDIETSHIFVSLKSSSWQGFFFWCVITIIKT